MSMPSPALLEFRTEFREYVYTHSDFLFGCRVCTYYTRTPTFGSREISASGRALSVHIHFHGSGALGYVGRAFDPPDWPLPARDCRLHRRAVRRFGGRTLEVEPKGTPAATS